MCKASKHELFEASKFQHSENFLYTAYHSWAKASIRGNRVSRNPFSFVSDIKIACPDPRDGPNEKCIFGPLRNAFCREAGAFLLPLGRHRRAAPEIQNVEVTPTFTRFHSHRPRGVSNCVRVCVSFVSFVSFACLRCATNTFESVVSKVRCSWLPEPSFAKTLSFSAVCVGWQVLTAAGFLFRISRRDKVNAGRSHPTARKD